MRFIRYSIKNTIVTNFLVVLIFIGGILAYTKLGKLEDPAFTIKEALVVTLYPGADAHRVELQVTDKIEEALQKIPNVECTESVSKNGYSQVKIKLNESLPSEEIDQYWDNVRKKLIDAKLNLPLGVVTPIVIDDYGSVYGIYLGVTGDGYSYTELDKYAKFIKKNLSSISGVSKIEEFGIQKEAIYLKIKEAKFATMNLNPKIITAALIKQNLVETGAVLNYGESRVDIDLNTQVDTVKKLEELIIFSKKFPNGTNEIIRLKDIVDIEKGYADPYSQKMYYNEKQAIGISISPEAGTNVVKTGEKIDEKIKELESKLPAGIKINKIYYQPDLVTNAINNFLINLALSIITVVGVLLLTMGMRSGLIIGMGLLLAILGTMIFMIPMGISIQRVSLGTFIIAMGMLVDNSIVIVDGVLVRIHRGENLEKALHDVTIKNSIPLLGATFIAAIAFLPGSLMPTYAGEYLKSSFWVILTSLLLSWLLSLTQIPVYCKMFLKNTIIKEPKPFEKRCYVKAENILEKLINNRKKSVFGLLIALAFSLVLFSQIPKTFFPDSDKKMFRVNIWVKEGSKIDVVEKETKKLEKFLKMQKHVIDITMAIGASPPRYYVATIPQTPNPTFGQLIVKIDDLKSIEILDKSIKKYAGNNMPGTMISVKKYPNGIATEYPIEVEFSGRDPQVLRELSEQAMDIMRTKPNILNLKTNWRTKVLTWEGDYSQIISKKAGVSPMDVTASLMVNGDGKPVGRIQEDDKLIPVYLKKDKNKDMNELKNIGQTPIWGNGLESHPLSSLLKDGKIKFKNNEIWRRNRTRSIKIQANIPVGIMAKSVRNEFKDEIESINLPEGYTLRWGGEYFEEIRNIKALLSSLPLTSIIMFTICVLLFASLVEPILIFLMLPLSIIGIAPGLFFTGKSFGFVSIIGLIALAGIMIKNLIVLMDEINYQTREMGLPPKEAVIKSTISRTRAVGLAALTTIFGMLPLLSDPLYGGMAATIIFGLLASTVLTLFIFPVIYVTAKRIH
ncbi:MAG: MFS transporter [Fusobacteriia bacterium 4572_74]|nr:MAG: MFS transporter [Fusobacteriia bacterium 4572_74]